MSKNSEKCTLTTEIGIPSQDFWAYENFFKEQPFGCSMEFLDFALGRVIQAVANDGTHPLLEEYFDQLDIDEYL